MPRCAGAAPRHGQAAHAPRTMAARGGRPWPLGINGQCTGMGCTVIQSRATAPHNGHTVVTSKRLRAQPGFKTPCPTHTRSSQDCASAPLCSVLFRAPPASLSSGLQLYTYSCIGTSVRSCIYSREPRANLVEYTTTRKITL